MLLIAESVSRNNFLSLLSVLSPIINRASEILFEASKTEIKDKY